VMGRVANLMSHKRSQGHFSLGHQLAKHLEFGHPINNLDHNGVSSYQGHLGSILLMVGNDGG